MNLKHLFFLIAIGFCFYFFKTKVKIVAPQAEAEILKPHEIKAEFPVITEASSEAAASGLANAPTNPNSNSKALPGDYDYPVRRAERAPGFSENWDFRDSALNEADLSALFEGSVQPAKITYFGDDGIKNFEPVKYAAENEQNSQTWYTGSSGYSKKIADARKAAASGSSGTTGANNIHSFSSNSTLLPENSFEVYSFKPGTRDDGSTLKPVATSILAALQGPDYSTADLSQPLPTNYEMRNLLSTILSLGYGGELTLKIAGEGYLADEAGFDFALFENAIRVNGKILVLELGQVGVSYTPDEVSFKWFDCRPSSGVLDGCFGAVPTSEGGDQFDLAAVGLKKIRYIKIRDLSKRNSTPGAIHSQ
jgi:hypothetical protein